MDDVLVPGPNRSYQSSSSFSSSLLKVAIYFRKTLYFLVYRGNVELKTRYHEFTDIIHQNKQGIDGKKRSGKEFIAFEQHVLDSSRVGSSARNIQSRFLPRFPVCFACYTAESFKIIHLTCIWFKFVDTTFHSSGPGAWN